MKSLCFPYNRANCHGVDRRMSPRAAVVGSPRRTVLASRRRTGRRSPGDGTPELRNGAPELRNGTPDVRNGASDVRTGAAGIRSTLPAALSASVPLPTGLHDLSHAQLPAGGLRLRDTRLFVGAILFRSGLCVTRLQRSGTAHWWPNRLRFGIQRSAR